MEVARTRWWEYAPGVASSMRIMAMMSTVTGCVAVLSGVVLVGFGRPEGAQIATVGAGMAGLGEIAKAWQAKGE